MNTLPARSTLRHPGHHQLGHVLPRSPRRSPWPTRTPRRRSATRRAGCTGECPWSRWSPGPGRTVRHPGLHRAGDLRALGQSDARVPGRGRTPAGRDARRRKWSRWRYPSDRRRIATAARAVPARRSGRARPGWPASRRSGRTSGPSECWMTRRRHPGRRALARSLWKNGVVVHAVRPPLAGDRPVGDVRDHRVRDLGEIADDVRLGRSGRRVEHLRRWVRASRCPSSSIVAESPPASPSSPPARSIARADDRHRAIGPTHDSARRTTSTPVLRSLDPGQKVHHGQHAIDLERLRGIRTGERAGQVSTRDRGEGRPVPPGARRGRRPHPVQADLRTRRQGRRVRRHREGLRE